MDAINKPTIVLGASPNPSRYSYIATIQLLRAGNDVLPVGIRRGTINGLQIMTERPEIEGIDTVTLYINPALQKEYYDYLIHLHPRRIIFNPGTENPELKKLAGDHGIDTLEACTLVLLSTNQY